VSPDARLSPSSFVAATVVVPNASLAIANGVQAFGNFAAQNISIGQWATIQFGGGFNGEGVCVMATCMFEANAPGGYSCTPTTLPAGTPCDDGNACTQTDSCQSGACVGSNPVVCPAPAQCQVIGVCNPVSGICSAPTAVADGTACNDGDACTQTDTCVGGVCTGSNPVVCTALDQCHVPGTCAPATGVCSNPTVSDGTSCNDGDACTQTDACVGGVCTGSNPVVCEPLDQCHAAGTCAPATGVCSNPTVSDGTSCNDGNACTAGEACLGGSCAGGAPVVCTALDQCHAAGTCNPASGCPNPVLADGTQCNDDNFCTQTDTCQSGTCTGSNPVVCAAQGQCHIVGTCDPGTGVCSNPPAADGTSCNDGDPCDATSTCKSGACQPGAPSVAAQSNPCALETCNPATGAITQGMCSTVNLTAANNVPSVAAGGLP
jgi:hypothetical protein